MTNATTAVALDAANTTPLKISARELAAQAIRRLRNAQAAGQVSFLAVHEDRRDLSVLVEPDCPTQQAILAIGCELGVVMNTFTVYPDLCLEGEATVPAITDDLAASISQLITRVTGTDSVRAVVAPALYAIAYGEEGHPSSVQICICPTVSLQQQCGLVCELVQKIRCPVDLVVSGEGIEVNLTDTPDDVWVRAQSKIAPPSPPVLPTVLQMVSDELWGLAQGTTNGAVTGALPEGWRIHEDWDLEGVPPGSLVYERDGLRVVFQYRRSVQ